MERRPNALTVVLGLLCAGLVAYIAFNKPIPDHQAATGNAGDHQRKSLLAPGGDSTEDQAGNGNIQKMFCALPPATLIDLIRNYKNQVWSKTSNVSGGQYDARFMEIGVAQLQNFIEVAKNSAAADGVNLTSIRLYYINYDGNKKTESYLLSNHNGNVFHDLSGCHSLAFVPVVGDSLHDPNRIDYFMKGQNFSRFPDYNVLKSFSRQNQPNALQSGLAFIPDYECNTPSLLANHNEICPPMTGCMTNTLLSIADND